MSKRVHTAVPAMRFSRTSTAQPPIYGVAKTSDWYAARLNRPLSWWRRLLGASASGPRQPH